MDYYKITLSTGQVIYGFVDPDAPAVADDGSVEIHLKTTAYNDPQAVVVVQSTPFVVPPTKTELGAYASASQVAFLAKGIIVNVGTSQAPVNVLCDGTTSTRADIAYLGLWAQANPTATKTWLDNNGNATVLTGAQIVILGTAVGNWIDNTYAALGTLIADIVAGTMTTTAEIDAYAWPTS